MALTEEETQAREPSPPAEQRIYARWLAACAWFSLVLLAATFFVYVAGIVAPAVPVADLPRYWSLSAAQYAAATGAPTGGWHWIRLVDRSDIMNLVGIACIAMVTPVCFLRLLLEFVARREHAYAAIAALELAVLVVAASGILAG